MVKYTDGDFLGHLNSTEDYNFIGKSLQYNMSWVYVICCTHWHFWKYNLHSGTLLLLQ